ncbi:MAG: alpha/beta hydrolase-fold protein [Pseudomonadota bacterium]
MVRATICVQPESWCERLAMRRLLLLTAAWSLLVTAGVGSLSPAAEAESEPERAFLGVQVISGSVCPSAAPGQSEPVCIGAVRVGGAAERAGLRAGDQILSIGGKGVTGIQTLLSATALLRVGQSVDISYNRGNETKLVTVHLGAQDRGASLTTSSEASADWQTVLNPSDRCEATMKADATSLPFPYRKQPLAVAKETIEKMLGTDDAGIVLDGDLLTLAFRAPGKAANVVAGSIQCGLDRVGDSNLWALQLRMRQWDQTFLSATFLAKADSAKGEMASSSSPKLVGATFRGRSAPPPPPAAKLLRGSLRDAEVPSRFLGSPRLVSVYLPPGSDTRPLPVLYLADGQDTAPFAAIVDSLIASGKIARMAIVGVHAGSYTGDPSKPFDLRLDDRSREYLSNVDPAQFERHMNFFVEELMPWAEKAFGISSERRNRAAMGYSNGGAFVAALGIRHPQLFATVLPFSPAMPLSFESELPVDSSLMPRFLFSGGELESVFLTTARANAAWLKARGVDTSLKVYWSGHDTLQWQQALADYLPEVSPPALR